jgi:ATP-dependent exoDNAse (exonuclease V) alpha subunit
MPSHPLQHLSIRVPWHDQGWNGTICQCPGRNTSCLKLKNIADNKDESRETPLAGRSIRELPSSDYPPCVKERATFMADFPFEREHAHPYASTSAETHGHFAPTLLKYPAYGAAALPFRWMMKPVVFGEENSTETPLVDRFPLPGVDLAWEKQIESQIPFSTHWVQDHRNHRALLDCFWGHIQPEESLVFFYAKQIPLVEDTGRRILLGVGRVKHIGGLTEYDYHGKPEGKIRSLLWERMVIHSIRPDFTDGFLLPYHQALIASDEGRAFDPAEVVAFAPEDRFTEFSFATEHVGHDAAIESLLACRSALLRAADLFDVSTHRQEAWIDKELGRLWKKRGPFPGMGAVLAATGIPMGHFVAQALVEKVGEEGDPWSALDQMLVNPAAILPKELARHIDSTITRSWQRIRQSKLERDRFLQLLSRIALTDEQARSLAVPEARQELGISESDGAYLDNPYLIYETTRFTTAPVSISTVDRGLFPSHFIREKFPIPSATEIKTPVDARRLRALTVRELESAALRGDTLLPVEELITTLRSVEKQRHLNDSAATEVTADLLDIAEEEQFDGIISLMGMKNGKRAYQLDRFKEIGKVISERVKKSLGESAARHDLNVNWRAELDRYLAAVSSAAPDEREEQAREEKASALAELAASRFSVLIGPAGTGKTTLLSVLCQHSEVSSGGILLLAPTGKARVRMEDVARQAGTENFIARTLAQHLSRSRRYDGRIQRYLLNDEPPEKVARTVIVDECSMLTEDMLAALLQSISGVHRLIFVGDPRQLPPIGAGRPFVDIVAHLTPDDIEARFPRVSRGFAELTIPRRQGAGERDDLQLASWFGGAITGPGDDQVFEILSGKRQSDTIRFIRWETPDELEQAIPEVLAEHLGFDPAMDEAKAFSRATGGVLDDKGNTWFNAKWGNRPSSGKAAEAWQILSPVRQQPWGVDPLNRLVHLRYKGDQVEWAKKQKPWSRKIPVPMGDQQIIYGDKVINSRNWSVYKKRIFPEPANGGYLANGEIGVVVGHRWTQKRSWPPKNIEIEFATQQGLSFTFYPSDFGDEGEAALDLAYALTIHKAQGSEFGIVFLILPRSPLMLTRELIYTALTRQRQKVVVLHQGDATELQRLSAEHHSATALRLTNLFTPPNPVQVRGLKDKFLEERLIHITTRADAVRSKSEVIIANLLHARGLDYHYEVPLEIDGIVKYPDFTIEDDATGITYYWEHCGMLHDPAYRRRWEEKKAWYIAHGITEAGGPRGRLIITHDEVNGSINSEVLAKCIDLIA